MSKILLEDGVEAAITVAGEASSSGFRKLLDTFCTRLSKTGLDILRSFCEQNGFCTASVEEHTAYLLGILVDHNIVHQDNLQLLSFVAKVCGQGEILAAVERFEQSRPALTESLSPLAEQQFSNVPGYTLVKLTTQGQAQNLDRDNVRSLCCFLADICGIDYHEMAWQGHGQERSRENQVAMMALLPNKCLSALQARLDHGDSMMENVGITNVCILENPVAMETESNANSTPVQELLRCIADGEAPSASALRSAVGPSVCEETIGMLLSCAAKHSNAAAVSEIGQLVAARQGDNIVDIMTAKGIVLGLKLLPNAYIAGRVELVDSLIERGFILHPSIEPYPALLTAVCQKQNYPCSLLESLLSSEDNIRRPFRDLDCRKKDVYEKCIELCCENDRHDLVEVFIKRQAQPSDKTLNQYSSCLGRAMSRIGSQFNSVRSSQRVIKYVDISWQNMGLCHVNDDWLSKANLCAFLARFNVSGNQLSSIPSCLFDGTLPRLEEVDCSHNKLKVLWNEDKDQPSRDRYRLKTINASNNELYELQLRLFQIPSLETLNVSHNDLLSLPGPDVLLEISGTSSDTDSNEAMQNCWLCTRLEHLDASHNHIRQLPEMFGHTLHLRKLDMAYNEIKAIPRSLSKAHFLEQADFSHNCLGLCPDPSNLSSLPQSVQRLNLSNNKLDCIPHAVVSITSLRLLNCGENLIASLPYKQQWRLPHLESLILCDNKLTGIEGSTEFPDSFAKSLTCLDVSHNRLKKFPEAVLMLKMAVSFDFKGNPGVNCLPPAIAGLKRLWEVKLDDMPKALRHFNPAEINDSGIGDLHYSKVKSVIRDKFYDYDLYYGIKLAISGSLISRDCVLRGLHYQPGQEHLLPAQFSVVTNVIYRSVSSGGSPLGEWLPTWLNKNSQTETKEATMKVWNVPDDRTLSVLQQVFFMENTVHLLVWHESDGQPGLNSLEHTLQLIRSNVKSVRTVLVLLTTVPPLPDIQEHIDKLKQSPELNHTVNVYIKGLKTVHPLPEEIYKLAVELADVEDNFVEKDPNRVPAAFRRAAAKMFYPETSISRAVCTRQFIQEQIFPDGFSDPDDFVQAMRFLMRIGALIHFEDTPRNLHEYFFTNIDLISRLLVALTAGNSPHLSSGVAHARHIYAVLNSMSGSEANSSALFALLVKVGVVGPLDCCHCLLPFRLPSERNGLKLTLSHYLRPSDNDGRPESSAPTYVRRLYSISGLPPSFWGRFINALVLQIQRVLNTLESADEQKAASNAVFWATGILALYNDGLFVVSAVMRGQSSEYMVPIECSKPCVDSGLDIVVFDRRRRFVALGLICGHVERLLQEWIDSSGEDHSSPSSAAVTVMSVERFVPSPPFSFDGRHSPDEILHDFIFEHAIPEEAKLLSLEDCVRDIDSPEISHLIPDIALASLLPRERLTMGDVTFEAKSSSSLGKGSFANVFSAYVGDEKVAFKMFADFKLLPDSNLEIKDNTQPTAASRRAMFGSVKNADTPFTNQKKRLPVSPSFDDETDMIDALEDREADVTSRYIPQIEPSQYFKCLQELVTEVTVMKQLQHKNIVQFKGVILKPCPCLVMEFAPNGNLATLISTRRGEIGTVSDLVSRVHFSGAAHDGIMGRELTHRIAFQIALGIEYLHSKAICHLDLKPENVLVWSESITEPVNVKLTDYGISCTVTAAGVNNARGTLGYQAPEQILSRNNRGESFDLRVDIYSYGMMLYYLLAGVHPFESDMDNPSMVEHKIRQSDHPSLPTGQSLVHLQSLLDRCWRYWPGERPSASQIVAEMCEPTFHIQCEDLSVNGSHCVLATAIVDDAQVASEEASDRPVSLEWKLFGYVKPRIRSQTVGSPAVPSSQRSVESKLKRRSASAVQSSSNEVPTQIEATAGPRFPAAPCSQLSVESKLKRRSASAEQYPANEVPTQTEAITGSTETVNDAETIGSVSQDDSIALVQRTLLSETESESEPDLESVDLLSLALVATNDSLLVGEPRFSRFLSSQKLEVRAGDVSAIMFLNDKLWVGMRSKQLSVFDCIGSEILRPLKRQTFNCNDVVEDIRCQISNDRSHAKVFALLANGDMVVVNGHRYDEHSTQPRQLTQWGKDSLYRWNQPEVRRVGKTGLEEEEAAHVKSCMVLARQGELWYCQGNSILVLNTAKTPEEVIWMDNSVSGDIPIPGPVKDAVVSGDSLWCCGGNLSDTICEVGLATRSPNRSWTIRDLRATNAAPFTAGYMAFRWCPWRRLAMCPPRSFQCLAAVNDTLWAACDNGAILVMHQDSQKELQLLTTLWCRSVLNHVLSQKRAALPTISITWMMQVGDRVLVYSKTDAVSEKSEEQTLVAEVFEARESSQIKNLTAYYNLQNV